MDTIASYLELLRDPYVLPIVIGILGFLVLILLSRLLLKAPPALLAFKNEFGTAFVTRKAICHLIQDACKALETVTCSKVRIVQRNKRLRIVLRLRIESSGALSEMVTSIQNTLTSTLRDNLNIENLESIDVLVTEIHPSFLNRGSQSKSKKATESTEDSQRTLA